MNGPTFYWHDYESFGANPRRDRPSQFAGLRTDMELNPIGEPLLLYCKPSLEVLPEPEACLLTGIGPGKASALGIPEAEFAARIAAEFHQPNTCAVGYNSIRFDDEVTRHLFYRNFYDPYEREWKNGNSRWDIIDLMRMAHALRPDGIAWAKNEDGTPSFRLEDLAAANGLAHKPHDALGDVKATLELARLVRRHQPRLFDYYFSLRRKNNVLPLLNTRTPKPLLHISSRYPPKQGSLAVVLPVANHPSNNNAVMVVDLSRDPGEWVELDLETLQHRLTSRWEVLEAEGVERAPLNTVYANRSPALSPLSVLSPKAASRWNVDLDRCMKHAEVILENSALKSKLQNLLASSSEQWETSSDPDKMLYSGGFFSDADRRKMNEIRQLSPEDLTRRSYNFDDPRLPEMLFRYRSRNHPDTLNPQERQRWLEHCRLAVLRPEEDDIPRLIRVEAELQALRNEGTGDVEILNDLDNWISVLRGTLGIAEAARQRG